MRIRIIKFLSGIFIIIIFLFGVGILVLPYLVSTDVIRVRLAQELSTWTGYNVQLRDPPRLNLFPYPRALLSGVTLTSKMDDVAPLMEAESIEVDLSVVDLLWGRVSFSETRIMRPQFAMEKPVKTMADFFDRFSRSQGALGLAIRKAREILKQNPDHPEIEHLLKQPFGRVVIKNGALVYQDSLSGVAEKITGLNATLDWSESTQEIRLRADARWHGEFTKLSIDAAQALLLLAGGKSQIKATLNSVRGGITFTGQARLSEYYIFDGKVSMRSPGWNQTVSWFGGKQFWGHKLKAPIVWESHFLARPMHIQMNNVTFTIGKDNARGALELDFQDYVPNVMGSLAFDNLDFNLLGSMFSSVKKKNSFFDMALFDRIGVDIRLSAPQAKIENILLTDLAAAIQIKNGYGIFDLGHANIWGGSVQSNIEVTSAGQKIRIGGNISGSSIDTQEALEALGFMPFVQSKINFTATIQTLVGSWMEVFTKMQGRLTLKMSSGRLLGYDLNELQTKLSRKQPFLLKNNDSVSTNFDHWDIQTSFSAATIKITESLMRTTDLSLSIQGGGTTALAQGQQSELILQAQLQKNHRSETLCKDVQCLANSLVCPFTFSLSSKGQDHGNFLITKDIDTD
ncbi:AsmA family protein [Bartonella krasnovii]|uniref:AsmA family protein n=1 Tax=Bartonella krasnovii TaxID=2267275 RepID=A0ABY3VVJ1_9HYPH|nr:AsmA family protein [Bartonella krasnovii]UNF29401.1 AsmA family protein [Bartonella krasnovii]UNF35759.1 AsmA family protein [Bartonella krasnovii]UNF37379.1 AsmA family protein [Bartonella krasnovii]UNF45715.1 AsmA family protein [Bartonella krasnovii]